MMILFLFLLFMMTAQAQDFAGVCCEEKPKLFERLARDIDQTITAMARNSWSSAIRLKEKDWPFAAFLLRYSLQDDPHDLIFPNNSNASRMIQNAPEYQQALSQIKEDLSQVTSDSTNGEIHFPFNSGDLAVALHNVKLNYQAVREQGKWKINISISDLYDFAHHSKEEVASFKIRVVNNLAYRDQESGIITPYKVTFDIEEVLEY